MSAECNALAGAASDGSVVGCHAVTYRLSGRPMRTTACRFRCVGQCLSRMRRKVQVRFLGEGAAATPLPYPTSSAGEDRLAARLTFPHRTETFFGPLHWQNDTDLWLDPGLGNQAYHVLHVFERAHDRTSDSELVGKNRK